VFSSFRLRSRFGAVKHLALFYQTFLAGGHK
jgi:hypothetical protein